MLTYDPDLRISARKALRLPFFKPLRKQEERRYRPYVLVKQLSNNPDNPNSSKNLDETTVTDLNNLSDYNISHRSSKKGTNDISNSMCNSRKSHERLR